ncbi:hypothetical protein SAMD00019534_106440 [Acytostelium subglobosum LB1]|uniref:hypothetical protein n=1 Tax=Acytostelium subglobosum LB1 TaxID=1410327 RepID=UPI0006449D5F|nr:hypothetical protein SAMD00019534_106440 [Acytostelium subglobosum LB1]GAM27468.1 hypothetical protein SAMD00019534_106440 [Acytostelium subglobosum LB1]|eukprot:XP_012749533.1 hypothetical protein SAMD00019534_106440 [Acytostelium subglobosum LB1]
MRTVHIIYIITLLLTLLCWSSIGSLASQDVSITIDDLDQGPDSYASDVEQPCNIGIIHDWGFSMIANNNSDQPWSYSVDPGVVDISFHRQLDEGFQETTIFGYYAAKIGMITDYYQEFVYFLNQTVTLPDVGPNEAVEVSFTLDTPLMNVYILFYIDDDVVFDITPTFTQYESTTQSFIIPFTYLTGKRYTLAMAILFPTSTVNYIYVEDYKAMRIPIQLSSCNQSSTSDIDHNFGKAHAYYVSTNGSDITGNGTMAAPYSSVQQAILFSANSNSTIYLMPGSYCGLGNSYLDTKGKDITLRSYDETNRSIITGQDQLDLISFVATNVYHSLTLDSLVFERPNTLEQGSAILISGMSLLYVNNCHFGRMANNSITLNYLNNIQFNNSVFEGYTGYALYVTGLFGDEIISMSNCVFRGSMAAYLLNLQWAVISNSTLNDGSPGIDEVPCALSINIVDAVDVSDSRVSMTTCAMQSFLRMTNVEFASEGYDENIILVQNSALRIRNSTFQQYAANYGILAFQSNVTFDATLFNTSTSNTIMAVTSQLIITNCTFMDELNPLQVDMSTVNISNTMFQGTRAFISGTQSMIHLSNNRMEDMSVGQAGNILNSEIHSTNNIFHHIVCSSQSFYNLYETNLFETSNIISDSSCQYIEARAASNLQIYHTQFLRNIQVSLIGCYDTTKVQAFNITGSFNSAPMAPVLHAADGAIVQITQSNFDHNHAGQGGVMASSGQSTLNLINSTFELNSAQQTGGLVYTSSTVEVLMDDVMAVSNWANEGSIIYYLVQGPLINGSTFTNNTQTYGNEVALGTAYFSIIYTGLNYSVYGIPPSIDSGSHGYRFDIQLQDANGNNLTNKFCHTSTCYVYVSVGGQFLQSCQITPDGTAHFVNITLFGDIGATTNIVFSSNEPNIKEQTSEVTFNNCSAGHMPSSNDLLCSPCQAGSYGSNGLTCSVCPSNVVCNGPSYLPADGYWIEDSLDDLVAYQCPPGLCHDGNCSADYTGPLCAECIPGYYNCGSGCKHVDGPNITVIVLKLLISFFLVLFQQMSDNSKGLVTIAMYFVQNLVVISNGIKFSIMSAISGSQSSHTGSGGTSSIISFMSDCMGPMGFYTNHYIILMQPLIMFAILLVIVAMEWGLRRTGILFRVPVIRTFVNESERDFRSRQFSAFIKICMNSYGPFITEIMLILFCYHVGSYVLLNANQGVQCAGDQYDTARKVTLGLMSFVFLFPSGIMALLFYYRRRMHQEREIGRKLGVFFLKYKPRFYFWDVVLLCKRLVIVTLSLLPLAAPQRSISLVVLSFGSLFLQLKYQPFVQANDNHLETISLMLLFVCCIYLDNALWETTEQWIIMLSLVVFIIAALRLQFDLYWRHVKEVTRPLVDKLRSLRGPTTSTTGTSRKRTTSSSLGRSYDPFDDTPTITDSDGASLDPEQLVNEHTRLLISNVNIKDNHFNRHHGSDDDGEDDDDDNDQVNDQSSADRVPITDHQSYGDYSRDGSLNFEQIMMVTKRA